MSQNDEVLNYIKLHGGITPVDAINNLGVYRLSARIYDLKRRGEDIVTQMVNVENRHGETVTVAKYVIGGTTNG